MAQTVRLLGVPVDLFLRAANHHDELIREFALISFGDRSGVTRHQVPGRLLTLVDLLRDRYARPSQEVRARVEEAAERRDRTVDLELPGTELVARLTEDITEALDEADEFGRSGDLLTWQGVALLAAETGLHERTAQRATRRLQANGHIAVEPGGG